MSRSDIVVRSRSLVPGDPTKYQVDDVVLVKTKLQCDCAYAESKWRDELKRSSNGFYVAGGRHEEICKVFHKRKFTRLSDTEVLVTSKEPGFISFTATPIPYVNPNTGKTEAMHVKRYIARRKASGKKLFEDPITKQLWWYGKAHSPTQAEIDALWVILQAGGHTPPTRWQFTVADRRNNCPCECGHLTPQEANDMMGVEEEYRVQREDPDTGAVLETLPLTTKEVDWETDRATVLSANGKTEGNWQGRHHMTKKRKNQVELEKLRDMNAGRLARAKDAADPYDHRDDQASAYAKTIVKSKKAAVIR